MKWGFLLILLGISPVLWPIAGAQAGEDRTDNAEKTIENVKIGGEDQKVIQMMELLTMMDFLTDMELLEGQEKVVTEEQK
ncbi:MAG: hypothetical protein ABR523_12345 [Desulfurivibrionaceae bacterium]